MTIPDRCPCCRSDLPSNSDTCTTCGAWFTDGPWGLRGRPNLTRLARSLAITTWALWLFAVVPLVGSAVPFVLTRPGTPAAPVGLSAVTGASLLGYTLAVLIAPASLATFVAGARADCRRAVWFGFSSLASWVVIGLIVGIASSPAGSRAGEILALAAGVVYTGVSAPAAWRTWTRPLPEAKPWECFQCGYLLHGLKVPRCPECGTKFEPHRVAAAMRKGRARDDYPAPTG